MLQFDEHSNGSTIELANREEFKIILRENPTTGFRWNPISSGEPVCTLLDNSFELIGNAPGSGGNHSWRFQTMKEGSGKIEFAYQRPWDQVSLSTLTFTLSVYVRT